MFRPPHDAVVIPVMIAGGNRADDDMGMPVVSGALNGVVGKFEVDTRDRSGLTLFGPCWRDHRLD